MTPLALALLFAPVPASATIGSDSPATITTPDGIEAPVPASATTGSDSPPAAPGSPATAPVPSDSPATAPVPSDSPAPPVPADSQPAPVIPPDAMRVRLGVDIPVITLGMAIGLGIELAGKEQRWEGCGACDPARINALDRTAIGNHNHAAKLVSDVGMVTAIGLPFALDLGDALIQRARDRGPSRARHMRAWGKDVVVLLETFAVTYALTNTVKYAVRRPRPYSYDPDSTVADPLAGESRVSFYSGHAALSFAMATAYASVFQARHPRSRWVAPVWVIGMSLASVTAVARVEAGKHFWTDVIVGALAGTAIGLAVPVLHRTTPLGGPRLALQLAPNRYGSLLVAQGRF